MATNFFGWNLLYNSISKDIKSNQDILFCLAHYVLISNGFQCIGLGDSKNMDGEEEKTEALPDGWNDSYHLRYVYQGRLYLLQGTALEDAIMINLIRPDERTTSMVQLNSRAVLRRTGSIDDMIPNNKDIVKMIKDQLIDQVTTSKKYKESTSQTVQEMPRDSRSSQSDTGIFDHGPYGQPQRPFINPQAGIGVGSSDLDPLSGIGGIGGFGGIPGLNPLGSGGGGMLFQPPRPGPSPGIPGVPGAVPPGARFDPFRPPDVDRFPNRFDRRRPDNDEMPPPGFDDMYM